MAIHKIIHARDTFLSRISIIRLAYTCMSHRFAYILLDDTVTE